MKSKMVSGLLTCTLMMFALGCSQTPRNASAKEEVERALNQSGLANIGVAEDRDKGVITLTGDVATQDDKDKAGGVAKSVAGSLVIANQIGVRPPGFASEAKKIDSSLDTAIEKTFEAVVVSRQLDKDVTYSAKNGVLTIKGNVNSQDLRSELERLASSVPNVKEVVNELQVKEQKATARGQ